ncbi:MAG TPA: nucleotidyltransferase domain-containing protein [Longimicrobium sp.]|nr:nucleotidyltransferase domain-containing protein [Longimicrobium sp.]
MPRAAREEGGAASAAPLPLPTPPVAGAERKRVDPRYEPALEAVREEMDADDNVVALLFYGSAQRGEAKPGSDLDLCALTEGSERWTRGGFTHGVEVQLQYGPVRVWRGMVELSHPVITSAFATGELMFDKTGEATELKKRAEEVFRAGPRPPAPLAVARQRYSLTNMVRDLEDLPEQGAEGGILGGVAVMEAMKVWCSAHRVWADRKPQVMMRHVRERDASLAARIDFFCASVTPANAIAVADTVLEMLGGRLYELSTPPEAV